ncbi:MAG: VOC family protein [Anaerolineales bacterium]|nr:VOC family protein [Anaerolineales bacterium]
MIKRVSTVSVFVSDQDRAKDFYTQVLGFELRRDEPLFPALRRAGWRSLLRVQKQRSSST